jgi:hypothetical protein
MQKKNEKAETRKAEWSFKSSFSERVKRETSLLCLPR